MRVSTQHFNLIDRKSISPTALALAFLLFGLTALCVVPQVWAQTVAGSISALSGSATITRGSATIPAANGTKDSRCSRPSRRQ